MTSRQNRTYGEEPPGLNMRRETVVIDLSTAGKT
jgi:hypothetical protein